MNASTSANLGLGAMASGCRGADGYAQFATKKGYRFIETVDWTSSAGDWTFIVSKSGKVWRLLFQENNYPRGGFSYSFGDKLYRGTAESVLERLSRMWE